MMPETVEPWARRTTEPRATGTPPPCTMCDEVAAGLTLRPPKIAPKFFYDDSGARLFDRITQLDAYYLTRAELAIYDRYVDEMAQCIGAGARIIEFGSGSGVKTRTLLRSLERPSSYIPVDIAEAQLRSFAASLRREFPRLDVLPVCADYTGPWRLPVGARPSQRTVAFFPGSTIGNFERAEAVAFLQRVRCLVGLGGGLLIGVDLHKRTDELERAYNDPEGITAAFNLNLLHRLNRECGADFDVDAFTHQAVYDTTERRIEMRLVSRRSTTARLPRGGGGNDLAVRFAAGDYIITEYSHKFTLRGLRDLARHAGWTVDRLWLDDRRRFSVWLLTS